jgi:hypothetical protein
MIQQIFKTWQIDMYESELNKGPNRSKAAGY